MSELSRDHRDEWSYAAQLKIIIGIGTSQLDD